MNLIKNTYYQSSFIRFSSYFLFPRSYSYSNLRIMVNDILKKKSSETDVHLHITEGMNWLYESYNKGFPGSSGFYNMNLGWQDPYPETTGYIIETFFDYADYLQNKANSTNNNSDDFYNAAINMTDWLISVQLDNGAFPGGLHSNKGSSPNVFNTGQIMIGLLRTYDETQNSKYLESAQKAGDWLVNIQNEDGSWSDFTYEKGARSYHSRVSWPLLVLYQKIPLNVYKDASIKNIDWVLNNQRANFWFEKTNFFDENTSLTHTLAYTLRGLLESALILENASYFDKVVNSIEKLMKIYETRKYEFLPAVFDENWKSTVNYSCLTGCAQFSIILSKMYLQTKDIRYFNTALKINSALKSSQLLGSYNLNVKGAIKGSDPVYGAYMPFSFPNWATKFYVDALLLETEIMNILYTSNVGDTE